MATRQELEQQVAAANAREIELYQNYQTVRRIAAEDAMFDTDGNFSEAYNIAKAQPNVYAAKLAWQTAGKETDALREQLAKIPLTPQQQTDIAAAYDNATRTTWDDPTPAADPIPQVEPEPFTTTPQTSTADRAIPYVSDEMYLDPLYEPAPTSPTVTKLPTSPYDINQDGTVSDSEYLYGDDELYEPVPTDAELASINEQLIDEGLAQGVFADTPEENPYFYLDHADDLDEIAAKYGVDPTSTQAAEIWAQEYGSDPDLVLSNPNEGFSTTPAVQPPASIQDLRKPINKSDWRLRVRLAPPTGDNLYLYNAMDSGILNPLKETDGVIFPYTPSVVVSNRANYQQYDLPHSNARGYFYTNSRHDDIMITATFTAQDTKEANYLLAVMHFFKSATRMFYGQDSQRGTPPPLLYLNGYGEYGFNEHPVLLQMVNFTLPDGVDYIKTSNTTSSKYAPTGRMSSGSGMQTWSSKITRLATAGLESLLSGVSGSTPSLPGLGSLSSTSVTKITDGATYVPTTVNIQLNFLPVNTRKQISEEYSLKDFASGKLLKKGYW